MVAESHRSWVGRLGCEWYEVSNKFWGLRLPAFCKLYRICKKIWVSGTSMKLSWFLIHFIFSYENVGTKTFPCYYSRAFNELVIARYSWDDNLRHMILSIIIPNVLFIVSIGVLSYWYCPCAQNACHKNPRVYAEFPSAKEKWVLEIFYIRHFRAFLYYHSHNCLHQFLLPFYRSRKN